MRLPVMPPVAPMLAQLAHQIPEGDFQFEPKWDGFRAIVFRDGPDIDIQSRNSRPLNRYFPELVAGLKQQLPPRIVIDGEIVIAGPTGLDFELLQLRLHPAGSRVEKLAKQTPAQLIAFDVLALGDDDLRSWPLHQRRAALERALAGAAPPLHLTPATGDPVVAADWFSRFEGAGLDGVLAKPLGGVYVAGERVMTKVKHSRTADCVVAGYRLGKDGKGIASLLLGLYDATGRLHHVGVASGFAAARRRELAVTVKPFEDVGDGEHPWGSWGAVPADAGVAADGARAPGGQSRWSAGKDMSFVPLRPELVAEVTYDHLQGPRFRHATKFARWRPDRVAASCRYDQLETVAPAELADLLATARISSG